MRRALRLAACLLALAGCAPAGPRPIAYGTASCAECRMIASDARFGAELVTAKGKLYVFDSIECLAAFVRTLPEAPRELWVSDYARPGTLVPVDSARFHRLVGAGSSPMGKGLVATRRGGTLPADGADAAPAMAWPDVLALLRAEDMAGEAPHGH
jgi:copper chaperone NosL